MKNKEDITEEEAAAETKFFLLLVKEGFLKRNWFNLIFLILFSIASYGVCSELLQLVSEQKFDFISFILILFSFLFTFSMILINEIANKEIDRYCKIMTEIKLAKILEEINAKEIKVTLNKEEEDK